MGCAASDLRTKTGRRRIAESAKESVKQGGVAMNRALQRTRISMEISRLESSLKSEKQDFGVLVFDTLPNDVVGQVDGRPT